MWEILKRIFSSLWQTVVGVVYLGKRLRSRELQQREADTKYYFKQQSKKELARFQIKEQMFVKAFFKAARKSWLPKKYRGKDIYVYHNYFANVLAPMKPNMLPPDMLRNYWDNGCGPYFLLYKAVLEGVEEICRLRETSKISGSEAIRKIQRLLQTIPDLDTRAGNVLEVQKKVHLKLLAIQKKLNEDRQRAMDMRDREMLDIDTKILSNTLSKAGTRLKELKEARKQQGVK